MTSDQAMRYWKTNGLIAAELYEADLRRLRHTIAQLRAELTHAYEALNQARQESFYVREYLDEARSWIRAIHDEVAASPQTREEWRDGLCRGSVAAALSMCKHALGEIPEGGEVVFRVRQKLASSARGEGKGEA